MKLMSSFFTLLLFSFSAEAVSRLPPKVSGNFSYQGTYQILGTQLDDFIEIHSDQDSQNLQARKNDGFDCSEVTSKHWYCLKTILDRVTDPQVAAAVAYDYGKLQIQTSGPLKEPKLDQDNSDYSFWTVAQNIRCDGLDFKEAHWALSEKKSLFSIGPNDLGAHFDFEFRQDQARTSSSLFLYRMFYLKEGNFRKISHVLVEFR